MMIKRLVYERADGGITVVVPGLPEYKIEILLHKLMLSGMTREEAERAYLQSIKERKDQCNKDSEKMRDSTFIGYFDVNDLPPSREFRNQWRKNPATNVVHVDPVLETEERWKRIRVLRNKLLAETDGEILRDQEQGKDVQALKAYRQALRDMTTQPDPKNIVWPAKPGE